MNLLIFTNRNSSNIIEFIKTNYIKKGLFGRANRSETEYLMLLLEGKSNHLIYQKLLEIIPPFYAHLFAYFFNVVQPFPVPTIYVEDYHLDITRNMLDHASQISFECLVFVYSTFELEERLIARVSTLNDARDIEAVFRELVIEPVCEKLLEESPNDVLVVPSEREPSRA